MPGCVPWTLPGRWERSRECASASSYSPESNISTGHLLCLKCSELQKMSKSASSGMVMLLDAYQKHGAGHLQTAQPIHADGCM